MKEKLKELLYRPPVPRCQALCSTNKFGGPAHTGAPRQCSHASQPGELYCGVHATYKPKEIEI